MTVGRRDEVAIAAEAFDLVVFDLDGVVTRTATVHAAAWQRLFDGFLEHRDGSGYQPFDVTADYLAYVDGRQRYDGVRTFLASRGIRLPEGTPADPPGEATVCGLGNAKNRSFLAALEGTGVAVYEDAVDLIRRLRDAGIAVACVSASENCAAILERAGIADLFDVRVDGLDIVRLHLAGKPAPDTFLEAGRRLGVAAARAAVLEDALVGVEAGRAGGFARVIGVDRAGHADAFLAHGADVAIDDLSRVRVTSLPSALDRLPAIAAAAGPRPLVALDYDGTLTPIVDRPEDARLPAGTRRALQRLAGLAEVAVVTGRDLETIRGFVDLDLHFASDHGFVLSLRGGQPTGFAAADALLAEVDDAERALRAAVAGIAGCLVERKRYSVAVHDRLVAAAERRQVADAAARVLAAHPRLVLARGKRVLELRPDLAWDKGHAVLLLAERLGRAPEAVVFAGDDLTDEDAFRAIRGRGTGIVVGRPGRPTAASHRLDDPAAVCRFLTGLADRLEGGAD